MAAHVYDGTYQRVMTISCCDFQSEDKDAKVFFWQNLNHVMARHGIPHPTFIVFMADNAQTNWNVVRIVYGLGGPKVPMEGRAFNIGMRHLWKRRRLDTLLLRLGGRHQIVDLRTVSSTSSSCMFFGTSATFNGLVS
jgi:hypothetical protein